MQSKHLALFKSLLQTARDSRVRPEPRTMAFLGTSEQGSCPVPPAARLDTHQLSTKWEDGGREGLQQWVEVGRRGLGVHGERAEGERGPPRVPLDGGGPPSLAWAPVWDVQAMPGDPLQPRHPLRNPREGGQHRPAHNPLTQSPRQSHL